MCLHRSSVIGDDQGPGSRVLIRHGQDADTTCRLWTVGDTHHDRITTQGTGPSRRGIPIPRSQFHGPDSTVPPVIQSSRCFCLFSVGHFIFGLGGWGGGGGGDDNPIDDHFHQGGVGDAG